MSDLYSDYTFSGKHTGGSAVLSTFGADYVHAYYFGEVRDRIAACSWCMLRISDGWMHGAIRAMRKKVRGE